MEVIMRTSDKQVEGEYVACEICMKEIPIAEATTPETTDYVVHFCGLECYAKWKNQRKNPDDKV